MLTMPLQFGLQRLDGFFGAPLRNDAAEMVGDGEQQAAFLKRAFGRQRHLFRIAEADAADGLPVNAKFRLLRVGRFPVICGKKRARVKANAGAEGRHGERDRHEPIRRVLQQIVQRHPRRVR